MHLNNDISTALSPFCRFTVGVTPGLVQSLSGGDATPQVRFDRDDDDDVAQTNDDE